MATEVVKEAQATVAVISAAVSNMLKEKLELRQYRWTDSQVVLGYINNEALRTQLSGTELVTNQGTSVLLVGDPEVKETQMVKTEAAQ